MPVLLNLGVIVVEFVEPDDFTTSAMAAVMLMSASCAMMEGGASKASGPSIVKKSFGTTNTGEAVDQFILTNGKGASVSLITYGATVTSLIVPDRAGKLSDVAL